MSNSTEKYKTFGGYTPDIDESRENIDKGAENESVFIDDLTNTTVEEKDSTTTPCYREMTPLILKLVTGSIILATPWLIIFLLNPNVRILKKMSIYDPNYNKKALLQSIMAFSLVSSMCWALWIISKPVFCVLPDMTYYALKRLKIIDTVELIRFIEYYRIVENHLRLVFVSAIAVLTWASIFFDSEMALYKRNVNKVLWCNYFYDALLVVLFSTVLFLLEKVIIKNLSEVYDSVNYNDRSEKQTKIQEAIVTLETSDYKAPVVHVLKPEDQKLRVSTISKRRSSILDLQILNKIRREDVYKSGEELFKKILGSDKRNYLTYEDFIPFFDDSEKAAEAYELFDPNKNGNVSLDEFLDVFFFCYSENKLLVKVKLDMSEVLEKLHTFMLAICLMIIVVVVLMLFSLEPLKNLSGLATLVIAWSFMFGNSCKRAFDCFVFLFVNHPYDVGDRVYFDGETYMVLKIRLLSTVFRDRLNQVVNIPNSLLMEKKIANFRLTQNQKKSIILDVSFNTPTEKLLELTKRVQNFVDSNKLDFKSPMQVKYRAVEKSALMKIEYLFTNRSTWQNNANKWKVSNKFFLFVKEQMADLGITYSTEMQNIRIHNAHQADIDFSGETSA